MLLRDRAEDPVPVRATVVRGRTERGDRVLLSTDVLDLFIEQASAGRPPSKRPIAGETHNDVVHVVLLNLRSQVNVNFNPVLGVLLLDGLQQRVEPLRGAEVTDDPGEVDLRQARRLRLVEVVHAVPDRLQDAIPQLMSIAQYGKWEITYEANGVTPIPAPTNKTVS